MNGAPQKAPEGGRGGRQAVPPRQPCVAPAVQSFAGKLHSISARRPAAVITAAGWPPPSTV